MKFLIAYIAPNERVMAEEIITDNQSQAIRNFKRYNPCCEIIAITLLEDIKKD